MSNVDNTEDILDSRDIVARIEELESDRETLSDAVDAANDALSEASPEDTEADQLEELKDAVSSAEQELADWDENDGAELKILQSLAEEASRSPDWTYGETLVRDSYFEDYARQLAEDIGAIDPKANWPNNCIDWERAAEELKQDYFSVDFNGIDYWIRS